VGTRTRTVMFTDLADYTAAVGRSDREQLRRLLSEHEELVSPIVRRYHGEVVKNLGDSYMCLFDSATDALRAALDIQDFVRSTGDISLKIGVTTGDVEEIDGDAFGEPVNLASRILSKTPAGEVWFGTGTRACMNGAEIPWEGVGRFRLKGIAGDSEVFRAVPDHRCWLPEPVTTAVKRSRLVRLRRGRQLGSLPPPDPVILLEGFAPGSAELSAALSGLPVLDPASLWLAAYHISPADRHAWTEAGRGLIIGTPQAIDRALLDAQKVTSGSSGSDTILLEVGSNVDIVMVISGLALPAVPLSGVVASYFYDLLPDGRWVNRSDRALVRVEVLPEGARLHITSTGITIDGRMRAPDEIIPLEDGLAFETSTSTHQFRKLDDGYEGVLLSDTPMRLGVVAGQTAEVGREPNHPGLAFPDRRGQSNIRWCSGNRAARARTGGFTLDRALAGRRQASICMVGDHVEVVPLHPRCSTWVLPQDGTQLERITESKELMIGDHIVAGTTVVGLRGPESL
jgi:hypothetical protein